MTMQFKTFIAALLALLPAAVNADPVSDVIAAANRSFARMPAIEQVAQINGNCGADASVNSRAVYCTTRDTILIAGQDMTSARTAYLLAHIYGHAAQVQHGVADIALRTIQARRSEEVALRALVARQVDCVAGVLYARAGLPLADLRNWFSSDPFADVHWGRHPLRSGPVMGIGLNTRNAWFQKGQKGRLSDCSAGEFPATLLVQADRF